MQIGDEVVCVDTRPATSIVYFMGVVPIWRSSRPCPLRKDKVYIISDIVPEGVMLLNSWGTEMTGAEVYFLEGERDAWNANRFRKVEKKSALIRQLLSMKEPAPEDERDIKRMPEKVS